MSFPFFKNVSSNFALYKMLRKPQLHEKNNSRIQAGQLYTALENHSSGNSKAMTDGLEIGSPQVYGIATYDALFKYILSNNDVRPSFLHAFLPDLKIKSSQRLDEHMNPIENFQLLRNFLHKKEYNTHIELLAQCDVKVVLNDELGNQTVDETATQIMKEFVGRFEELKIAFPQPNYNGTMDFVCQLENDDYAMIEMQVIPQDYWDRRALAYVAAFYGNQLKKGGNWRHIRKVIGINILGGGKDSNVHWQKTSNQYMRDYKVQEQLHQPSQFIDGIELLQYSIMNAPEKLSNREVEDWITFFRRGHFMTEEDVVSIIETTEVKKAFEMAKISKLPNEVRIAYQNEDLEYDRYSKHTQTVVDASNAQTRRNIASKLIAEMNDGFSELKIAEITGLSEADVRSLKSMAKTNK